MTRPWESAGAAILLASLLIVAVGAPGAALLGRAGLTDPSAALSGTEFSSLAYSTAYALVGSGIAVVLGAALVSSSRGGAWVSRTLNGLTLGAMAVPGLVLGAAYVIAFNGWIPLYGTPLLLLAAYVVTHLPVLMRLLDAPLRGAHSELTDAARVHGLGCRARLEQVHLPLLLQPLLWAWAVAFGSIFFELPLSALLHPVGSAPVGVHLLTLDETLRFGAEARLALAGGAVSLAIVVGVTHLLPRWLAAGSVQPVPASAGSA